MNINGILYAVIFITCLVVSYFDLKYQKVPLVTLVINYVAVCYLIGNPGLYFGVLVIFYALAKDLPIDLLYVALIAYLIIIGSLSTLYIAIALLFSVIYIMAAKKNRISFLLPLEVILVSALI